MLASYYGMVTHRPGGLRRRGREIIGDVIMATFNTRGDEPNDAVRAARAALELQREMLSAHGRRTPDWPDLRAGVNSGEALVRELGGRGYLAYAVVGDTINVEPAQN